MNFNPFDDSSSSDARLTQEQAAALTAARAQENVDALAYVNRYGAKEGWSPEDLYAVVGALGLDGVRIRGRSRKGVGED
jgi:hypothetical protein